MISKKLIYNPFKKEFWEKENLLPKDKVENLKVSFQKMKEPKESELAKKLLIFGEKMRKWGGKLTFGLSVPLLLTVCFGWVGLGIGALIAIGIFSKKTKN
jgi:hypothetical protein